MTKSKLILFLLCLTTAAVAGKIVFEVVGIPSCRSPENYHQPHKWLSQGRRSEREPIDSKTPITDCARRDVYQTCKYCLSTFSTKVEFEGPKCPTAPPRGCQ